MARRHSLSALALAAAHASAQVAPKSPAPSAEGAPQGGEARSDDGGIADIIVTAQRRSERLQDVSAQETRDRGVTRPLLLAGIVPNLNLALAAPTALNHFIRGVGQVTVGINAEPSVAPSMSTAFISRR